MWNDIFTNLSEINKYLNMIFLKNAAWPAATWVRNKFVFSQQLWEDKEGKKKMNKNNAKALSTLRQKIRKYNRDFETEIATYKEVLPNPLI